MGHQGNLRSETVEGEVLVVETDLKTARQVPAVVSPHFPVSRLSQLVLRRSWKEVCAAALMLPEALTLRGLEPPDH